jgi:inhibitor of cysteine peptidase
MIAALLVPFTCGAQPPKVMKADDSFNGRQVEIRVGETLEVRLSENASTGYRWAILPESARKFDKVLHERGQAAEGAGSPPGKPGTRDFRFEAVEPGAVELELEYRRPWEAGKAPTRRFKLRVRVLPASGN